MFDFLNRIFEWVFQFVPQFSIVPPDERGVFKLQYGRVKPHKIYLENVGTSYGRIVGSE